MGTGNSKYKIDGSLPKPQAKFVTFFYGRMTPNSPDGKDLGLSEPAPTWDFPKSGDNVCFICPQWQQTKLLGFNLHHDWNASAFDPTYQPMLGPMGISEQDYSAIIANLNKILEAFTPFTRDSTTYITVMRRHLTKIQQDYPQTRWELQIHKFVTELSSTLFFENVFHSLKVSRADLAAEKKEAEELAAAEVASDEAAAEAAATLETEAVDTQQ